MAIPSGTSARVGNYKSFGPEPAGFHRFAPCNVILGKNNTGKSALLDLIDSLCTPGARLSVSRPGTEPIRRLTGILGEQQIERVFSRNTSGGRVGDITVPGNHYQHGMEHFADHLIAYDLTPEGRRRMVSGPEGLTPQVGDALLEHLRNPFEGLQFRRIFADRDLKPEGLQNRTIPSDHPIQGDGTGTTNLIRLISTDVGAIEDLVRVEMLDALNRVFQPDSKFERVMTKHHADSNHWEIFLEEEGKGNIPLSASGSGLKTVLIVLAHLLLLPTFEARSMSNYLFGFEELENNLHPGIQRRLFGVIRELAITAGSMIFITTHSSVVIDLFSSDEDAQLLHVTHDGDSARVEAVGDLGQQHQILSDLDIRASDLLQANGIIWVEGPSDRIYVNAYLRFLFGDRFREGAHYQCVFYGGRLLARVTAGDELDHVRLLRVNRHCAVLIDRDSEPLNETKRRIITEVEEVDGHVWVTRKKEIECLIPAGALESLFSIADIPPVDDLEAFDDYLDRIMPGTDAGKKFRNNKMFFAERVCEHISLELIESDGDLLKNIQLLGAAVADWNPGS